MKEKKCFLYGRQSSGQEELDNSTSLCQQIENCRKCAAQNGLTVLDIFTDANVSGKTYPAGSFYEKIAENDPGFQKWYQQQTSKKKYRSGLGSLLSRLDEVEYIVVDEITRLHRSAGASFLEQTINYAITESHVKILQVKGGIIDLSKFDQNLIQILRTQINDEQISNQKRKSMESRLRLKNSGILGDVKFFAGVYDGNKQFHYDPEKIPVIQYIFESIAENISYGEICYTVNKRWKSLFHPGKMCYESTMYNIARQPVYAGLMYNSEGDLIPCRNSPEPIIEPNLFLKVKKMMELKRRIRARPKAEVYRHHFLPLSGLLKCGCCGGTLRVNIEHGKIFYICRRGLLEKNNECRQVRILDYQENKEIPGLRYAVTPLLLFGIAEQYRQLKQFRDAEAEIVRTKEKIQHLSEKISTAFQLYLEDMFDKITYIQTTHQASENLRQLKLHLKELEVCRSEDLQLEESAANSAVNTLLSRKMPEDSQFLYYLQHSIKEILVFPQEISVKTVCGEFRLARLFTKQNRRIFPCWKIEKCELFHFLISYELHGIFPKMVFENERIKIQTE